MWLPWSIISFFSYYFVKNEEKKYFFPATVLTGLTVFILFRIILSQYQHTLVLQYNKYPPNLYYLSYGITCITLLYYFFSRVTLPALINRCLNFFSRYSYEIFFSHWFVLYVLSKIIAYWNWQWWQFTLLVFTVSVIIQLVFNQLAHRLLRNRKS